jgi:hypothetical protein
MDQKIMQQILKVRDSGEANMFDASAVKQIAMREGFLELADYVENHRRGYASIILTGKAQENE